MGVGGREWEGRVWVRMNANPNPFGVMDGTATYRPSLLLRFCQTFPGYCSDVLEAVQTNPGHVLLETFFFAIIVYLVLQKSNPIKEKPLTEDEVDALCEEWTPEPLAGDSAEGEEVRGSTGILREEPPVVETAAGPHTTVNGVEVINFASTNFLGLLQHPKVQDQCEAAIHKYGCGSCGPRGFYGTIDVHLELERRVARFLGQHDSLLYSYDYATATSTIPAFAKREDVLIVDAGCHWGIRNGVVLSKARVLWFAHNDMDDLERQLLVVAEEDKRRGKGVELNRRFIVAEGIYVNHGDLAPLPDIVRLKEQHKFRLILDESVSIGALGATGRGATELWGLEQGLVDITLGSLGHAFASIGGFTAGGKRAIDHQRLNASGYVFSASLPPFLAAAAIGALDVIEGGEGKARVAALHANVAELRRMLLTIPGVDVHPKDAESPLMHLRLEAQHRAAIGDPDFLGGDAGEPRDEEDAFLQRVCARCLADGDFPVLLTRAKYSRLEVASGAAPPPSIRLAVSAGHSRGDLGACASALRTAFAAELAALGKMAAGPEAGTPRKTPSGTPRRTPPSTPRTPMPPSPPSL